MCRIISFLSASGGVGKTTIIYNVSKYISRKNYKVCIIDGYFKYNTISNLFTNNNTVDFKEYIKGKIGTIDICNKYNDYLYFVKTNDLKDRKSVV